LDRGIDTNVWEFARENGFVIVSKDSDFNRMSAGRGHPPKVIWLRAGNCPAREIENRLRSQPPVIHAFEEKPDRSLLVLP
jgi:predicted nuclease of predicted toxin-antitoxin system